MVERPGDLGGAEIGIEQQAGAALDHVLVARLLHRRAETGGPPVLPDDGGSQRLAGPPRPEEDRLALVGDSDRTDSTGAAGLLHHRPGAGKAPRPDLLGVVLDQSGPRIMLDEVLLLGSEAGAARSKQHRPRAGRAFVDDEKLLGHPPHPSPQRRLGPKRWWCHGGGMDSSFRWNDVREERRWTV